MTLSLKTNLKVKTAYPLKSKDITCVASVTSVTESDDYTTSSYAILPRPSWAPNGTVAMHLNRQKRTKTTTTTVTCPDGEYGAPHTEVTVVYTYGLTCEIEGYMPSGGGAFVTRTSTCGAVGSCMAGDHEIVTSGYQKGHVSLVSSLPWFMRPPYGGSNNYWDPGGFTHQSEGWCHAYESGIDSLITTTYNTTCPGGVNGSPVVTVTGTSVYVYPCIRGTEGMAYVRDGGVGIGPVETSPGSSIIAIYINNYGASTWPGPCQYWPGPGSHQYGYY